MEVVPLHGLAIASNPGARVFSSFQFPDCDGPPNRSAQVLSIQILPNPPVESRSIHRNSVVSVREKTKPFVSGGGEDGIVDADGDVFDAVLTVQGLAILSILGAIEINSFQSPVRLTPPICCAQFSFIQTLPIPPDESRSIQRSSCLSLRENTKPVLISSAGSEVPESEGAGTLLPLGCCCAPKVRENWSGTDPSMALK